MRFAGVVLLCSGLGFLDGASLPHKYSSFLTSPLTIEGMERDNVRQWEYVTPASEYARRRSEADQVKVNASSKSLPVDELQQSSDSDSTPNESSILADVQINEIDVMRIVRQVGSYVVLPGFKPMNQESIQWNFLNYKTKKVIVQYLYFKFKINPFYSHRAEFNVTSGTLLLRDLQLKDSGIYEVILNPKQNTTFTKGDEISSIHLDVQEQLPAPLIIQSPVFIVDRVQLSCFIKSKKISGIIWRKDNTEIVNDTHHRLEYDSSTLFIDDMEITDCGLYSCTVMNKVSKNSNTHFLSVDGNLFIHEDTLVGSIIALVSTVTSFTASAFIVYALEKDQVKIYWLQVTSAILVFHGLSLICQLISFVIFNINTGFPIGYRVSSGISCIYCLATVIYVMVLFLHHHSEEPLSFLSNYWKRNIFLGSEVFAVLIAGLPVIKSKQNIQNCSFHNHALSVKIILMVILYVCGLGLFALFYAKFYKGDVRKNIYPYSDGGWNLEFTCCERVETMNTFKGNGRDKMAFKMQRNYVRLKEVKRFRQSKNEEP